MEKPSIPTQLKNKYEAEYPGYWSFWQRFNNWMGSIFDQATNVWTPPSLADSAAPNNSVYYSTTASRLVYKNSVGVVNNLY